MIGTNRRQLKRNHVTFRPRLVDAHGRIVRFADGSTRKIAAVIWATGYRSDYSWIHIPDLVDDGRVTHRRGVTHVPGLYFLGLSKQHTRGSALLGFVNADATHLAHHITTHRRATAPLSIPSETGSPPA